MLGICILICGYFEHSNHNTTEILIINIIKDLIKICLFDMKHVEGKHTFIYATLIPITVI